MAITKMFEILVSELSCVGVCVCVSHSVQRVSQYVQGGQACHIRPGPTKLGCDRGSTKGRLGVYLQDNCCSRCLLSWFASMVVLMIDPKPGFHRYVFSN